MIGLSVASAYIIDDCISQIVDACNKTLRVALLAILSFQVGMGFLLRLGFRPF